MQECTRRQHRRLSEAVLLLAGLVTAILAVVSPVGYWSGQYLWVRATQDLLLCFAAPMLIAAGCRSLPTGPLAARVTRVARVARVTWPRAALGPVVAVVVFNLFYLASHVPAVFDFVTGHALARLLEQSIYLGTGAWFWLQILRPRPGPWQAPLRRLELLIATIVAWTVLGMVLVFGSNVIYPAYANPLHQGMTVLNDQQLSGGVLWMGMMPFFITAGVILLNAWLNDEEADLPADAETLTRRSTRTWTARSGLR